MLTESLPNLHCPEALANDFENAYEFCVPVKPIRGKSSRLIGGLADGRWVLPAPT
jgi:hypothetical protein